MMGRKRKAVIPLADISGFSFKSATSHLPLNAKDQQAITHLVEEFRSTGVLDRAIEERPQQSVEEIEYLVADAAAHAKSEKELNPSAYDAAVAAEKQYDAPEEEWDNPLVEELTDYERSLFTPHPLKREQPPEVEEESLPDLSHWER